MNRAPLVADTLVIPLGATEQHGPHLPLDTDTVIASALVERLAAARPGEVRPAPAIPYGSSGEHAGFAGTLSIGQQALWSVLVELGRDASRDHPRVLVVNAHGGNAAVLASAMSRLRSEGRDVRAWSPDWGGDAHAGRAETSLMLALTPSRVVIERASAGAIAPLAELLPALRARGVRAVSENGVRGDPAGASSEEGEAMLSRAVFELVELIDDWEARGQ